MSFRSLWSVPPCRRPRTAVGMYSLNTSRWLILRNCLSYSDQRLAEFVLFASSTRIVDRLQRISRCSLQPSILIILVATRIALFSSRGVRADHLHLVCPRLEETLARRYHQGVEGKNVLVKMGQSDEEHTAEKRVDTSKFRPIGFKLAKRRTERRAASRRGRSGR